MTNRDRAAFVVALTALAELPNGHLTDARIEAYWLALHDLDLAVFQAAAIAALKGCKFFPAPAEIRELAEGSPEDRGQRAWAQLQQAATAVGGYASIRLEDPATATALVCTFGSWVRFCTVELDPPMWASKRKEFAANYRIAQRQPEANPPLCLPGIAETHNRDTAAVWGAALQPIGQTRGLLLSDGTVEREPMVLDPDSGRLLPVRDVPQIVGAVEPKAALVDVTRTLREAAESRAMDTAEEPTKGVCSSCGATRKDREHAPTCDAVRASNHEALVRRQAMTLVQSEVSA
jgi:hypothetical protein